MSTHFVTYNEVRTELVEEEIYGITNLLLSITNCTDDLKNQFQLNESSTFTQPQFYSDKYAQMYIHRHKCWRENEERERESTCLTSCLTSS